MKKKNYVLCFIKEPRKINMIEEHRSVQEDGTLDLRGIVHIKFEEYISNHLIKTQCQTDKIYIFINKSYFY